MTNSILSSVGHAFQDGKEALKARLDDARTSEDEQEAFTSDTPLVERVGGEQLLPPPTEQDKVRADAIRETEIARGLDEPGSIVAGIDSVQGSSALTT